MKDTIMRTRWLLCALTFCATLGLAAETSTPDAGEHAEDNPLALDGAAQTRLGIVTTTIQTRELQDELRAPGEVQANAYATSLVASRIPAQIVRRHVRLGDLVKAGQTMVTLSSIEVAEAQGALIVAERDWQRVKTLGSDAVSGRRYTEAQVARDQARARLRAYGIGDGEIAALLRQGSSRATGEFTLPASQTGRVTMDDFIVGERVEAGKPLFTVVDETTVWIEAQLAPDATVRVRAGAAVRVLAHAQALTGKVVQLSHRSSERSRTTPVRIEVANIGDVLHAGEFVETHIAIEGTSPVLAVPNEAVVQLQGETSVFRKNTSGDFEIAPFKPGETRGDFTIVEQGLASGDIVVVKGSYALKARLLKSQLGEGHGH